MNLSRRCFLQGLGAAGVGTGWARWSRAADGNGAVLVRPTEAQARWQEDALGLVYHFDLDVYMPGGSDHERSRREVLDPSLFRPEQLDTDQWLAAAQAAGAKYAILTATHHQGFLQWQSEAYPFGLRQIPWRDGKADIVADFVASCRRVGIRPGIYLGIRFNAYWQVYNYEVNGGRGGDPERRAVYMRHCEALVRELCTGYGELCEFWFDGGVITPEQGGPDVLPIVAEHQPGAVFYHSPARADHRWAGNEAGTAGAPCWATLPDTATQARAHTDPDLRTRILQHGDPDGRIWCPAMCDAPIREHDWLWRPERADRLQSVDRLEDMYLMSVGRNANLILGAVPDTRGLIPEADMARYAELGQRLRRRFARPLAETTGRGREVTLTLPRPARAGQVVIEEVLRAGERVRAYAVEGLTGRDQWTVLCAGQSIGHRRIQSFADREVAAVRLRVGRASAEPRIAKLAVYGAPR